MNWGVASSNHKSQIMNHKFFGVSRITAWLTQASDKVLPDRPRAVSVTACSIYDLLLMIYDLAPRRVEIKLGRCFFKS